MLSQIELSQILLVQYPVNQQDEFAQNSSILFLSVFDFIGKLIHHIPSKHLRMIHYSGIFTNRIKTRYLLLR